MHTAIANDRTEITANDHGRRPVDGTDAMTTRAVVNRSKIVDFGDWSAESSPGGFAAFLDRILDAHTDDVNAAIDIGMARTHDATDSLTDMLG